MLLRATENAVAGHIWPAGRYLPTPALAQSAAQLWLAKIRPEGVNYTFSETF